MTTSFQVRTEQFEGPFDLLLSLIQERKLYINEISLANVTDEYLAYVQRPEGMPIAETAQFVWVAATLLLIKSRSLLPNLELTEEEQEDIRELERRLQLYRLIRRGARALGKTWDTAPLLPPRYAPPKVEGFTPGNLTLQQLTEAVRALIAAFPSQTFRPTAEVESTVTLAEVLESLQERILQASRTSFNEIRTGRSKPEVIIHFLALLEILKSGIVTAEQSGSFSDIVVKTDAVDTPRYGA